MNSCACARRAACSISLARRPAGPRVGDVLGDGGGEQERVVADDRDGVAQRARRSTSRTSAPSISTAPSLGSYSRGISATRLVLPEPVGADERDGAPGGDVEVDVAAAPRARAAARRARPRTQRARAELVVRSS